MNYYANLGQDWKEETYCNNLGKSGLTFMHPVGDVRSYQVQNVLVDLCIMYYVGKREELRIIVRIILLVCGLSNKVNGSAIFWDK